MRNDAVEQVIDRDSDFGKVQAAHDAYEHATAAHNDVGSVGRKAGVVLAVCKFFGGQRAEHFFYVASGHAVAVQLGCIKLLQTNFDSGNSDDAAGHTNDASCMCNVGVFAQQVVHEVGDEANGVRQFFGFRWVVMQFAFGKNNSANRETHGVSKLRVANHHFGAATADVDNQRCAIVGGEVRNGAGKCQTRFGFARNDFGAKAQHLFGCVEEYCRVSCASACFGGRYSHEAAPVLSDERFVLLQPIYCAFDCVGLQLVAVHHAAPQPSYVHFANQFGSVCVGNQQVGGVSSDIDCCKRRSDNLARLTHDVVAA